MINDADTLRWLAQQNCITPHVWNARCDRRDQPDRLVFDLDPTGDDFDEIREGALAVAEMLRGDRPDAVREAERLARDPHRRAAEAHARRSDEVRAAAADAGRPGSPPSTRTRSRPRGARRSATAGSSSTSRATRTGRRSSRPTPCARCRARRSRRRSRGTRSRTPALTPQAFTLRGMRERIDAVGDPWADIADAAATLPASVCRERSRASWPLRLGAWASSTRPRSSPSRRRPSSTRCSRRSTSRARPSRRRRPVTEYDKHGRPIPAQQTASPPHGDPLAPAGPRRPRPRGDRHRPGARRLAAPQPPTPPQPPSPPGADFGAPPHADPIDPPEPVDPPDPGATTPGVPPTAPSAPVEGGARPPAMPGAPPTGEDRNHPSYAPPKFTSGDPLAG